jgi:hypothetical protein
MKSKQIVLACLLSLLAASAWAANPGPVAIYNEDGSKLYQTRYLWFSKQRVLVPVKVYEKLGFHVFRNFRNGTVRLRAPQAKSGFSFAVDQRNVKEEAGPDGGIVRYEKPVVQIHNKEFYIAAMPLKEYFPTLIETEWDSDTRSVRIRRTHEMNRLLGMME